VQVIFLRLVIPNATDEIHRVKMSCRLPQGTLLFGFSVNLYFLDNLNGQKAVFILHPEGTATRFPHVPDDPANPEGTVKFAENPLSPFRQRTFRKTGRE
jgi:hypothetical protein